MLTFDHLKKALIQADYVRSVVGQADDEALGRQDAAALDVYLVAGGPRGVVGAQLQIGQHLAGQEFLRITVRQ